MPDKLLTELEEVAVATPFTENMFKKLSPPQSSVTFPGQARSQLLVFAGA